MGIAVLGSILTWQYGARMLTWLNAHGVPVHERDAIKSSIGGALRVAGHARPEMGSALAQASNRAFLDAIHLTVLVALIVVLGGIVLTATFYPRRGVRAQVDGYS